MSQNKRRTGRGTGHAHCAALLARRTPPSRSSRTVVAAVRIPLPSSNRFGVWLSREGSPNKEACREQPLLSRTSLFRRLTIAAWNGSRRWAQIKATWTHVFC